MQSRLTLEREIQKYPRNVEVVVQHNKSVIFYSVLAFAATPVTLFTIWFTDGSPGRWIGNGLSKGVSVLTKGLRAVDTCLPLVVLKLHWKHHRGRPTAM